MTRARRRALAVLAFGAEVGRPVFESNQTTLLGRLSSAPRLTVYWQSRRWLEDHGFITARGADGQELELTDKGRAQVRLTRVQEYGL